ncbi:unnamed protein product [marine sediment metagenome]|uniref:Uncharacterized protein n=1 Tax=marine sediment metagenome TaxID=412755 RepID=X1PX14_9ZZZZ
MTTVRIAIEEGTGRSRKPSTRIETLARIYINGTTGYPGILYSLFFKRRNLKTPITARIGKIPREKPI